MSPRIAVFNHSSHLLMLYKVNLTHRGFETFTFEQEMTTLEEVQNVKPDLLILGNIRGIGDIEWELLRLFRDSPEFKDIPVIISTTAPTTVFDSINEIIDNCYIITKPFDVNILIDTVNRSLNQG